MGGRVLTIHNRINGTNVGVIERRNGFGLALETHPSFGCGHLGRQNLERYYDVSNLGSLRRPTGSQLERILHLVHSKESPNRSAVGRLVRESRNSARRPLDKAHSADGTSP